jgi:hypothetical protein
MTKIDLIADLSALKQDRQGWGSIATSPPSEVTPSLSATDSLSAISSVSNLAHQRLVLNASKYSLVPHGALPENKEVVDTDNNGDMFSVNHCIVPCRLGHDWYLQLGFKYIKGQDSRATLLMGLSVFMEIMPTFIDGFELLPLSDISTPPALTSNDPDPNKGFPKTAVLAFKYFLVKNKTNVRGVSSQSPSTQTPQNMRHNDEEEFKPPTMLWGVVWVQGNKNVKEAIVSVALGILTLPACLLGGKSTSPLSPVPRYF